ncbi:HET-domain-containing protein, partial [Ophiobolus disseminans]
MANLISFVGLINPEALDEQRHYSYQPLEVRSIRLLKLLPCANRDAPIRAHLSHFRLDHDNPTDYEALSYVWGAPGSEDTIHIGESVIQIRQNLGTAIRQLRCSRHATITIWIDAICINQGDMTEKNHQVSMMGEIYSRASQVVVWLGRSEESANRVSNAIVQWTGFDVASNGSSGALAVDSTLANFPKGVLNDILSRPYWSRLWVVQEITLA